MLRLTRAVASLDPVAGTMRTESSVSKTLRIVICWYVDAYVF